MPKPTKKKSETLVAEPVDRDRDEEMEEEPRDPHAGVGANRVRAAKLRAKLRAGTVLSTDDSAWLADYEAAREDRAASRSPFGASRGRKTVFTEEEHEALGEGTDAAAAAAAAGAMVREEGRRLDSLVSVGITALKEACTIQRGMVELLLERNRDLETAHVQMMLAAGKQYVRGVEAEAEVVRLKALAGHEGEAEEKEDPITQLATELLPLIIAKMGGGDGGPEGPPPSK